MTWTGGMGGPGDIEARGGADEYAEFAARRWSMLVRSAVLLGCTVTDAEDLAQTTLLRALVAWPKVQRADNRDAYVARILLNVFRESRRSRRWRERPTATVQQATAPDRHREVDDADAVRRALMQLSPGQREALVLRYYVHLSEREIAECQGVASGTVKSRISRAISLLARDPGLASLRGERS